MFPFCMDVVEEAVKMSHFGVQPMTSGCTDRCTRKIMRRKLTTDYQLYK